MKVILLIFSSLKSCNIGKWIIDWQFIKPFTRTENRGGICIHVFPNMLVTGLHWCIDKTCRLPAHLLFTRKKKELPIIFLIYVHCLAFMGQELLDHNQKIVKLVHSGNQILSYQNFTTWNYILHILGDKDITYYI